MICQDLTEQVQWAKVRKPVGSWVGAAVNNRSKTQRSTRISKPSAVEDWAPADVPTGAGVRVTAHNVVAVAGGFSNNKEIEGISTNINKQ